MDLIAATQLVCPVKTTSHFDDGEIDRNKIKDADFSWMNSYKIQDTWMQTKHILKSSNWKFNKSKSEPYFERQKLAEGTPGHKSYDYATVDRMSDDLGTLEAQRKEITRKIGKFGTNAKIKGATLRNDDGVALVNSIKKANEAQKILAENVIRSNKTKEPARKTQSSGCTP